MRARQPRFDPPRQTQSLGQDPAFQTGESAAPRAAATPVVHRLQHGDQAFARQWTLTRRQVAVYERPALRAVRRTESYNFV